jgi:predicted permease
MPDWERYVRERLPLDIRPEREAEIVSELAQQLELKYSELTGAGMSHEQALAAADAQAGNWAALAREIDSAERPYSPDPIPPEPHRRLAGLRHDLHYAFRLLRKKPAFACVALTTLAFAIGANTAMFTIVDAVVLRALPYPNPDRLVTLGAHREKQREIAEFTSAPDFLDLEKRFRSVFRIAGISPVWSMITGDSEAERLNCLFVSSNFFGLLGARPAAGRLFTRAEDVPGRAAPVVVLSHGYWMRRFGGSDRVLNQTIVLDNAAYTVTGILPAGFRYLGEPLAGAPEDIDAYLPLAANPLISTPRSVRFMKVLGLLRPGASVAAARSEVRQIGASLAAGYPESNREMAWELHALRDEALGNYRSSVVFLLGAVGFVLLLAAANIANMLLARMIGRQQEISIRTALGASRLRIVRQLLAESLALAALGGICGTGVAIVLLRAAKAFGPQALMRSQELRVDMSALLFTGAIAVLVFLVCGLLSAWQASSAEIASALRAGGRSVTTRTRRLRSALVVGQVAIAVVLLTGSALLIRSFQILLRVNPGFRAEHLLTISTQVPYSARTPGQRTAIFQLVKSRLMSVPGVEQVAAVSRLPMMGQDLTTMLTTEGAAGESGQSLEVQFRRTTPDYFRTMGIPLLEGRIYGDADPADAPIAVVDETTARLLWPGVDAIGKRVKSGPNPDAPWIRIIGVAGEVHHFGLDVSPRPTFYAPYAASPLVAPIVVIRSAGDPAPMASAMVDAVRGAAKGMPAYNVFRMQTLLDRSNAQRRFIMLLLTAFAAAATFLAALGVYGSMSQTVSHRTREIGVRIALGASPAAALRLVLAEAICLAAFGVALGAAAALGLTRLMTGLLFGVTPLDPAAFLGAGLVLGVTAVLASAAPAVRATRVDPLVALRED